MATVFCCVCIIVLGIASLTYATPESIVTSIGENISTNNLSLTGAITSGSWLGNIIDVAHGGTGLNLSSIVKGSMLFFSDTGILSALNPGNAGQVLTSGGAGADPSWQTLNNQEAVAYIVYTDGTNIYAKNGSTGKIDYSGTDASSVIQNVVNNSEYKKIIISSGTYLIGTTINLLSCTEIQGSGRGANAILKLSGNASIFRMTPTTYNVKISSMTLDGNNRNYNGNGILIDSANAVRLQDMDFQYFNGSAIAVDTVVTFSLKDSEISDSGNDSMSAVSMNNSGSYYPSTNILFENVVFEPNYNRDLQIQKGTSGITINKCWFEGETVSGANIPQNGHINIDGASSGAIQLVSVQNSRFYDPDNSTANDIVVRYANQVNIDSNFINSGSNNTQSCAIEVIGSEGGRISNNLIEVQPSSSASDAVIQLVADSNYDISGNTIDSAYSSGLYYGIALNQVTNSSVTKNYVAHAGRFSLYIYGNSSDLFVENNTLPNNHGWNSVSLNSVANITITNNTIYNVNQTGVSDIVWLQNRGLSPYNFGNQAAEPTPFGAGDQFYNTTTNKMEYYNGTSWTVY